MLIEQIVEFELRGPCPLAAHVLQYNWLTSWKEILWVDYYLQLKNIACKILNVFWNLIASKKRMEQSKFFDWLSNVKNLVLSNGCEHVRNVIQWD